MGWATGTEGVARTRAAAARRATTNKEKLKKRTVKQESSQVGITFIISQSLWFFPNA
jgi:hypothetical protein